MPNLCDIPVSTKVFIDANIFVFSASDKEGESSQFLKKCLAYVSGDGRNANRTGRKIQQCCQAHLGTSQPYARSVSSGAIFLSYTIGQTYSHISGSRLTQGNQRYKRRRSRISAISHSHSFTLLLTYALAVIAFCGQK